MLSGTSRTVVLNHENTHGHPYRIMARSAGALATRSRCQRVSPVRLTRVMARRLRSRHTPKAEMGLLPVVARRHAVLLAPRTPLRALVTKEDARAGATGADCRTAARRSRAKEQKPEEEKQGKSGNILSAPSVKPRLLRERAMHGTSRPNAHCDLSRHALGTAHGMYLGESAYLPAFAGEGVRRLYGIDTMGAGSSVYEALRSIPGWRAGESTYADSLATDSPAKSVMLYHVRTRPVIAKAPGGQLCRLHSPPLTARQSPPPHTSAISSHSRPMAHR